MIITLCLVADITRSYEKQFAKPKPLVIKYYADWCMDCALINDVYDSMSNGFSKKDVVIASMDCTHNNDTERFCIERGIKTFPTVKLYNSGSDDATYSDNIRSEQGLRAWIKANLKKGHDEL